MNLFKKLYNWVLHWAETRYGVPVLFVLAMTEASVFPIPPDVLLMALCLGKPSRSFYFATICTVGSVLGGLIGYFIGFQFWDLTRDFFLNHVFSPQFFDKTQVLYQKNAFLSIFVSGFTPIPYKVFTISAGVFNLNLVTFFVASALARALRFFLVGYVIYQFGPPVKKLIDKYFEVFTIVFMVLLIGGFVLVKHVLH